MVLDMRRGCVLHRFGKSQVLLLPRLMRYRVNDDRWFDCWIQESHIWFNDPARLFPIPLQQFHSQGNARKYGFFHARLAPPESEQFGDYPGAGVRLVVLVDETLREHTETIAFLESNPRWNP